MKKTNTFAAAIAGLTLLGSTAMVSAEQTDATDVSDYVSGFTWDQVEDIDAATLPDADQQAAAAALALATPMSSTSEYFLNYLGGRAAVEASDADLSWQDIVDAYVWARMQSLDTPVSALEAYADYVAVTRSLDDSARVQFSDLMLGYVWNASAAHSQSASVDSRLARYFVDTDLPSASTPVTLASLIDGFVRSYVDLGSTGAKYAASDVVGGFTWGALEAADNLQTIDGFAGWGDDPVGRIQVTNGFAGWGDDPVGRVYVTNGFAGWGDDPVGRIQMTNGFAGWGDDPVGRINTVNGFAGWGDDPVGRVYVTNGFAGWGDDPVGRIHVTNGFAGWGDDPVGRVHVTNGFAGWGDDPVGRIQFARGTWGGLNTALLSGDLRQFDVSPIVADYIKMNRAVLN